MRESLFIFLLMMNSHLLTAQVEENDSIYIMVEGDSIAKPFIGLDEVVVFKRLQFKNREEMKAYYMLRWRVLKVYPYAKLSAERMASIIERLPKISKKRKRKQYLKMLESFVRDEYEAELRKLSRKQGQILSKLLHRETGYTSYNLIKIMRNGFQAFLYNTTASLFDISLKIPYSPETDPQDVLIEDILLRAFAKGDLEPAQTTPNQFIGLETLIKEGELEKK